MIPGSISHLTGQTRSKIIYRLAMVTIAGHQLDGGRSMEP